MPTSVGPNIKGEENLVFGYDLGDVINSYKGEPTTNIVPAPERNSRFTTDNSWYTYNTAQYNSNTYFSIGAVASVSNNEVTLSSVGRTLYTYDVLRPQTTGGGVTAGTNYMVKKTGTNKFTLHEYNGSQNGSQGYRDPATGAFKVHESVVLDQRISINATDFPTMWWGPPHVPNMCYVKEVVSSGGPNDNSSFMRIHLTRPAGTDGGMAYGVYPQVTQGDLITVSFWARSSVNSNWSWSTYFNAGFSAPGFGINSTTEWQRFEYSWTASNTFGFYMYFWPGNPGFVPYYVDLADIQVEVNKGHATSFTLSSRSATQGLLDLTGSSTIDLSNVSFDSNAQMTFDGTSDYVTVPHNTLHSFTGDFSIEIVFKPTGNTANCLIQKGSGNDYFQEYWVLCDTRGSNTSFELIMGKVGNTSANYNVRANNAVIGQYHHIVTGVQGSTGFMYVNGELIDTGDVTDRIQSTSDIRIGERVDGFADSLGDQPLTKIYNRALTANEIQSNFNAIKNRFNI
jgi:hypothetical protein